MCCWFYCLFHALSFVNTFVIIGERRENRAVKKTYQCSIETHQKILKQLHDTIMKEGIPPSIKELCQDLSITRGTFYLHFSSMEEAYEDLYAQILDDLKERVIQFQQDPLNQKLLPKTFVLFEWAKEDRSFYLRSSFLQQTHVKQAFKMLFYKEAKNLDPLTVSFLAEGISGFLQSWLVEKERIGAYEAAKKLDFILSKLK